MNNDCDVSCDVRDLIKGTLIINVCMGRRRKAEGRERRDYLPLSSCEHFLPFLPCATVPEDKNNPLLHTDL